MDYYILVIGIWFFILYGSSALFSVKKDPFSPIKFISVLYLIRNVPYILFTAFDESYFNWRVLSYFSYYKGINLTDAFIKYSYIQTIAFIFLLLGITSVSRKVIQRNTIEINLNRKCLRLTIYICSIIALIGYFLFLKNIGGLGFLLSNLDNRVDLQSGQHSLKLRPLLTISALFSIILLKDGKKKDYIQTFFLVVLSILVASSTGGRKDTLYLIAMAIICAHYYIKRISFKRIMTPKVLFLAFSVFFYIFFVPILRSKNGLEKFTNGEVNLLEEAEIGHFFKNISYTYIDVFTTNHFNVNNIWYLNTLKTIPSNLFNRSIPADDRPPIDEGIYIVSTIDSGRDFKPLIPRKYLREFSFPIENMGFAYGSLLLPGVIIFFFLQGIFIGILYNRFITTNHPINFYLYVFSIFNFNFSSLRIMNMITSIFLLLIFYVIYWFVKTYIVRNENNSSNFRNR